MSDEEYSPDGILLNDFDKIDPDSDSDTNYQIQAIKDVLKNFYKFPSLSKELKSANFEKSIESLAITVIKRVRKNKKIKNGKIFYNISNIESTIKRNNLSKYIQEYKKEFDQIIAEYDSLKLYSKKRDFLFSNDSFCYTYINIIDLIFYPNNPKEEYQVPESPSTNPLQENYKPSELQQKLKISCCTSSHTQACLVLWDHLKNSLLQKGKKSYSHSSQFENSQIDEKSLLSEEFSQTDQEEISTSIGISKNPQELPNLFEH